MEKIKYPEGAPMDLFKASTLIPNWLASISKDIELIEGRIINIDLFPGPRIGFLEIEACYKFEGKQYTERFFLSGKGIYIIPLLKCIEDGEIYTTLVKQPRVALGDFTFELPSGMADDSTNYKYIAVKELEEECGLIAKEDELESVTDFLFTTPHLSDDYVKAYYYTRALHLSEIQKLEGQHHGADEDEQISLKIIKLNEFSKYVNEGYSSLACLACIRKIKSGEIDINII